jgi:hypothetical protein
MTGVKIKLDKFLSCVLSQVLDNFIPPLLDAVLLDYRRCPVPSAREPEVLSTMATIIETLKGSITAQVPKIFDNVFECTLDMINKDFENFPEHRINFYHLLKASLPNNYLFFFFCVYQKIVFDHRQTYQEPGYQ